jgi:hypothetical protein
MQKRLTSCGIHRAPLLLCLLFFHFYVVDLSSDKSLENCFLRLMKGRYENRLWKQSLEVSRFFFLSRVGPHSSPRHQSSRLTSTSLVNTYPQSKGIVLGRLRWQCLFDFNSSIQLDRLEHRTISAFGTYSRGIFSDKLDHGQ